MGECDVAGEDQREHADQGVNADLGQKARKDGRDRKRRRVVGCRQPEKQRKHRSFDSECDHEHHRDHGHEALIFQMRHRHREVGEVQCTAHAVKQANAGQKQDRGDQVQGDVFYAPVDLLLAAAHDQEAKGRDQHHLEPDIEVEEVTGQERPRDPADQHVEERVIPQMLGPLSDVGQGINGHGKRGDPGDHDHDSAQIIGDERDAEGCRPITHLPGDDAVAQDMDHEDNRRREHRRVSDHADPSSKGRGSGQERRHGGQERQHERRGEEPAHVLASSTGSATRISSE